MLAIKRIARNHFSNVNEVDFGKVVVSPEVRKLCERNACGYYGRNWMCPPAVEPLEDFKHKIRRFNRFIVVHQVYPVKSSMDWNGMMDGARHFKEKLMEMRKEMEGQGSGTCFLTLGVGACHVCKECSYVDGEPCRRPADAMVSLEACGIDVMRLMKDNGLKYYNGKNTVTYIGGVMFADDPTSDRHVDACI